MCSKLLHGHHQLKHSSQFLPHYNDTLGLLISGPASHRTTESTGLVTSNHDHQTPYMFAQKGGGYIAVDFHLNEIFWLFYEFRFSGETKHFSSQEVIRQMQELCSQGKWWNSIRQIFSRFYKNEIQKDIPVENTTWQGAKKGICICYWAGEDNL